MAENKKILVVDDEPIIIKSAARVLSEEGYNVEGVLSGEEAMLRTVKNSYDLVLTDLRMPGTDGIALIRSLRKSQPSLGIVVITGYPSQQTIKEALELGIIDYVPKPFTPEVLKDVTHRAIEWVKGMTPGESTEEEFPPSMLAELDTVISKYRERPGSTIPALQRAQEIVGYLPPVIQRRIANGLNVFPADIHSIVSFYSFFTMKPRGDHTIRVCRGTACYVQGVEKILSKISDTLKIGVGETTKDRKFSLETVRCLGACGLAPVMVIDEDTHGALTQKKALDFINQYSRAGAQAPSEE